MKLSKKQIEFIKDAYQRACNDWKAEIKENFSELFESEIEVGKWYFNKDKRLLICCTKLTTGIYSPSFSGYGFGNNNWINEENHWRRSLFTPATNQEVETALIKEAKKRGFKEAVNVKEPENSSILLTGKIKNNNFIYLNNKLAVGGYIVFKDGKWATIIEEENPVKKEAEKIIEDAIQKLTELKSKYSL